MLALMDDQEEDAPPESTREPGGGIGVAQVEAARGRLVHAVEMSGERVARYRILAPTEWTFHPEGAAARGLEQIAARGGEHRLTLARLFMTAVDPCVGFDVRAP